MFSTDFFLVCVSQKLEYIKLFHIFFSVKTVEMEDCSKITFLP